MKSYLPDGWGAPSNYKGKNGGAVWLLGRPCRQKDRDKLHALAYPNRAKIDERSTCGKRLPNGSKNPNWTTYYIEMSYLESRWNPWIRFKRWMDRR